MHFIFKPFVKRALLRTYMSRHKSGHIILQNVMRSRTQSSLSWILVFWDEIYRCFHTRARELCDLAWDWYKLNGFRQSFPDISFPSISVAEIGSICRDEYLHVSEIVRGIKKCCALDGSDACSGTTWTYPICAKKLLRLLNRFSTMTNVHENDSTRTISWNS